MLNIWAHYISWSWSTQPCNVPKYQAAVSHLDPINSLIMNLDMFIYLMNISSYIYVLCLSHRYRDSVRYRKLKHMVALETMTIGQWYGPVDCSNLSSNHPRLYSVLTTVSQCTNPWDWSFPQSTSSLDVKFWLQMFSLSLHNLLCTYITSYNLIHAYIELSSVKYLLSSNLSVCPN